MPKVTFQSREEKTGLLTKWYWDKPDDRNYSASVFKIGRIFITVCFKKNIFFPK